eukprot:CAMPEP_0175860016 /NCGR_PEP_ID=MMETSP0107_2-20121207/30584_1 /TAXON_ID=195067 ORGANISM="Goniomonas pacifica, Strain CCMP1869" /NCGR_SAMPLE_ID=MMETSP0107_2 /ASSEMBLY_ACC=CAM_ASM_000203 /LENGTH=55 /DNA_ID=CAMNT_0017176715 /DNA_START=15 /DNA_END=182 /DNA_ORIENTATION=-
MLIELAKSVSIPKGLAALYKAALSSQQQELHNDSLKAKYGGQTYVAPPDKGNPGI